MSREEIFSEVLEQVILKLSRHSKKESPGVVLSFFLTITTSLTK